MRANELRIGNYVYYNGFTVSIASLIMALPREDKRFSDKEIVDLFDGAGLITTTIDEIEPIPLTEEWLLKNGFKNTYFNNYEGKIMALTVEVRKVASRTYMEVGCIYLGDRIKFVHEYQNLHFALTGQELEVTP